MATSPTVLHLFDVTTRTELKLTKASGFYHVGGKIYIADLYQDSLGKAHPVLNILREAPVEELPVVEITPATISIKTP